MALMRTTDHPELTDAPLRKIFFLLFENTPPEYPRWINVHMTRKNFEEDLRMTEFGTIPQHVEGDALIFDDVVSGQLKKYDFPEFVMGYLMTQKMREDDQHGIMPRLTEALRESVRNLFEVQAYRVLNNATSSTGERNQGFDGLALLDTAHPNLKTGTTQRNRPTNHVDLSATAVEEAVRVFHGWTGESDLPKFFRPSLAIVSGDDQYLAARIFRNAMQAGTANNDNNWVRVGPDDNGINSYIASRYLTDLDSWFILSEKRQHDLNMFVRVNPQFNTNMDFTTGNFQVKTRTRLTTSFGGWRGVYGSTGA